MGQFSHGDHVGAALNELLDFEADLTKIDVQVFQHVGSDAATLFDQPKQDMLGADVFVIEALGLLVGQLHHFAGAVGKSFVHAILRMRYILLSRPAAIVINIFCYFGSLQRSVASSLFFGPLIFFGFFGFFGFLFFVGFITGDFDRHAFGGDFVLPVVCCF